MDAELRQRLDNIFQSLLREMRDGFQSANERLDRQDARLERHAGLLLTASRWDCLLKHSDARIRDMEARLKVLESRPGPGTDRPQ